MTQPGALSPVELKPESGIFDVLIQIQRTIHIIDLWEILGLNYM